MNAVTKEELPRQGPIPGLPAQTPSAVFPTGIVCQFFHHVFRIDDIAPWGVILPTFEGMENTIRYNFEAETLHMPKGTVLGVRWSPHSGNNIRILTHTLPGDGNTGTLIQIPFPWMRESEGETVRIEYEASFPDGTVQSGRSFDVRVARQMEYGEVTIGDLTSGDNLNPDQYPDGIPVTIQPVVNVEEYNTIRFVWTVMGIIDGGQVPIGDWVRDINCEPGKTYEFVIPPEAYNDLDLPEYEQISIIVTPAMILLPLPLSQIRWGFGVHIFGVSQDTK